ncbi:hypothetical protein PACILC2_25890 [Paenibacillus cisolokensis]|uniref:Uncharacterized protein n=1 Tax=Paenibacillus cisolokensis TaxID=1658519 RepID=A0ABQ4N7Z1_9BACL|nr:hypothetical protein [Paenibacillus cisolokensis]GIQ64021.1 hypothetical protein PACILC2_25890 [Paenibacillus cisolokensis]
METTKYFAFNFKYEAGGTPILDFDHARNAVHALGLPPISSDLLRGDWVEEATY